MAHGKIDCKKGRGLFLLLACLLGGTMLLRAQNGGNSLDVSSGLSSVSVRGDFQPALLLPVSTSREVRTPFRVVRPPVFAVKTNLLYAATLTPNLGLEFGLGRKTTLELSGGYHPWKKDEEMMMDDAPAPDDKTFEHWLARGEFKYWLDGRFSGHYFGVQGLYADFDIHGYKIPMLLDKEDYNSGTAYGGGLSYGYHWVWSRRWGMEFSVGAGIIQLDYTKKECEGCTATGTRMKKTYVGPISAGVKLVFLIK